MTPETLMHGIRDADAHRGGISCLRLAFLAPPLARALRGEVLRLVESEPCSDVQEREHVTNWTRPTGPVLQFSLYNRSGDTADYRYDHDLSCVGKRFHAGMRYPTLAAFVASLPHLVNFRVNVLGPGAGLAPHEEHSLFPAGPGAAAIRARFHLPIRTSARARLMLDGAQVRFAARVIHYFNQGCVHGATNPAPKPRVHLVWDQLLTPDVYAVMFCEGPAPPGWRRLSGAERIVPTLARGPTPPYARLPPRVTPQESSHVGWSPVQ